MEADEVQCPSGRFFNHLQTSGLSTFPDSNMFPKTTGVGDFFKGFGTMVPPSEPAEHAGRNNWNHNTKAIHWAIVNYQKIHR